MNHRPAVGGSSGAGLVTLRQLRSRGWTRREVREWLGPPEHVSGGPSWLLSSVQRAERERRELSLHFGASRQPRRGPRQTNRRAERQLTALYAETVELNLEIPDHWRELTLERWASEVEGPPPADLSRLGANLVRHLYSEYDLVLRGLDQRRGSRRAYARIWRRMTQIVAAQCPELGEEFVRQSSQRAA